jgi:hypothetical protein
MHHAALLARNALSNHIPLQADLTPVLPKIEIYITSHHMCPKEIGKKCPLSATLPQTLGQFAKLHDEGDS